MSAQAERRRTFTVRPEAHNLMTCQRCKRKMRAGERATAVTVPGQAWKVHAGRTCPPYQVDRHPFIR